MVSFPSRLSAAIHLLCLASSCGLALFLSAATVVARAQSGQPASGVSSEVGVISINVTGPSGSAFDEMASISVYTQTHQLYSSATAGRATVRIDGVPLGTYVVQVSAPGYLTAEERVEIMMRNAQQSVSISMRLPSDPNAKPVSTKPPLLAPKAQKELSKGLDELRANRPEEAHKHLQNAARLAPSDPDVNYLLGVLSSQSGDSTRAMTYWEKAIAFDPNHAFSLVALASAKMSHQDWKASAEYLDRAVVASPTSWRAHALLAQVHLQSGKYPEAQNEAEQAVALGKEQANEARLDLAKALMLQEKNVEAGTTLQELLDSKPAATSESAARQLLEILDRGKNTSSQSASVPIEIASVSPVRLPALAPEPATTVTTVALVATPPLPPPLSWIPPDVDQLVPPVKEGESCQLDEILPNIQKKVVRFTDLLDRFTATEHLEDRIVNADGLPAKGKSLQFNYMVSMREIRPGLLDVDEYRDGSLDLEVFPNGIATKGLPSVILIFHPANRDEYDLQCEGSSSWRGVPAWQIHFRQRESGQARLRIFRVHGKSYPAPLKGRAWVSRDTFQVLRIETDLVRQIPEIKLFAEHQVIDYGPVRFPVRQTELWLPASTDYYTDFRNKRLHRRLTYADYTLFSVDDTQSISAPPSKAAP